MSDGNIRITPEGAFIERLVNAEDLTLLTGRCAIKGCWRTPHHEQRCFWHYHGCEVPRTCDKILRKHDFKHGACRRCHIPRGDLDPVEVEIARRNLSRMERYPV